MNTIALNKTVILQKGVVLKAVKLIPCKTIVFEKLRFLPENAVGLPFGSMFEVKKGELSLVDSTIVQEYSEDAGKDNRGLTDTHGKSQILQRGDLIQMKDEGATGEEIIQSLVKNSSSFSEKTIYSQKKYLKKKRQKHSFYLQIHRPTARLICKLYQGREPAKICNMQIDSLSQILCATNIRSRSKVAVFDNCSGVVLGAILERLGGQGSVVNLHVGETPGNLFAISYFNFPDSFWDILHSLPIHKISPLLASKTFQSTFPDGHNLSSDCQTSQFSSSEITDSVPSEAEVVSAVADNLVSENIISNDTSAASNPSKRKLPLNDEEKSAIRLARQRKRFSHQQTAWKLLESKNLDALVVATKYHPTPIALALLEVLAFSKPFAVYFEHKEPLMELFVRLSTSNLAINLQLTDTFMRQYQVLPERTHPHVMMSGAGGYVLTGIKVKQ